MRLYTILRGELLKESSWVFVGIIIYGSGLESVVDHASTIGGIMQKKLIALAVAGLVSGGALAQSNVAITGLISVGLDQYKLSGGASSSAENRITDQQSRIIFTAIEDLDNGMKAFAIADMRISMDTNQSAAYGVAAGNSGIGLSGNWGKLTIGRWELHYNEGNRNELTRITQSQSLGTNGMLGQVNGLVIASGTRSNNVVMYDTPEMNGVTGRLAWSANPRANEGTGINAAGTGNPGGGNAWNAVLRYANGPLNAGMSYYTEDAEDRRSTNVYSGSANADQRATRVYVGYALPMGLNVGFTYDRSKATTNGSTVANPRWLERNAWLIPLKYFSGAHGVYFSYGKANNGTGTGAVANADTSAKFTRVGYDYALSKRTTVGVTYAKVTNAAQAGYNLFALTSTGETLTTAGLSPSQLYAGISHAF
jgi:predicted porin